MNLLPITAEHGFNRRHGNLPRAVIDHLRELITTGMIRPGESLQIDAIADSLGVSATPVREALQSLRAEGFLDLTRGRGFSVHPLSPADIEDVFLINAAAAGELAARAVTQISPQQLDELLALHLEMQAAAVRGDFALLEQKNHAFHSGLYRVVDAPKLHWLVGLLSKYAPRAFYSSIEGWPEATQHDHEAIVAALRARDADAARTAMASHIERAGRLLAKHFASLPGSRPGDAGGR